MAFRIGEYVVGGEIHNSSRNRVSGWIDFSPGWGFRLDLCGNLTGQFEGRDFRFRVREDSRLHSQLKPGDFPPNIEDFDDQYGVIGDVVFHVRRVPTVPLAEFVRLSRDEIKAHSVQRDVLYLEWYGNNGRVVAEIVDVEIEFIEEAKASGEAAQAEQLPETDPSDTATPDITKISDGEVERVEPLDFDDGNDDDPFGLFDSNLESEIARSARDETHEPESRSWDEVIPGIDPETKAKYEEWDEVLHGPQTPVTDMFEPLQLPRPDDVATDVEAWPLVSMIVMRLATCSVKFEMCEHATPLTAYQCLIENILPIANVSPKAGAAGFVMTYSMWEYCEQCSAELD